MLENVDYKPIGYYRTYWVNQKLKDYQANPYPFMLDNKFIQDPDLWEVLYHLYIAFEGLPEDQKCEGIDVHVDGYYRKPYPFYDGKEFSDRVYKFEDADELCAIFKKIYYSGV